MIDEGRRKKSGRWKTRITKSIDTNSPFFFDNYSFEIFCDREIFFFFFLFQTVENNSKGIFRVQAKQRWLKKIDRITRGQIMEFLSSCITPHNYFSSFLTSFIYLLLSLVMTRPQRIISQEERIATDHFSLPACRINFFRAIFFLFFFFSFSFAVHFRHRCFRFYSSHALLYYACNFVKFI